MDGDSTGGKEFVVGEGFLGVDDEFDDKDDDGEVALDGIGGRRAEVDLMGEVLYLESLDDSACGALVRLGI